jgi:dienelactone hydrolase/uncharacterized membrane protein YozB (DUF420 family)
VSGSPTPPDLERDAVQRPSRTETLLFRLAMAVVAVAVVDDAFVHPEPGTSGTDHLAAGLLPVAVALALALRFPRMRAGLAAIVALTCAALAIAAGVADGVRHVAVDSLAGDDLTATLAALAGVLLAGIAVELLWRTRRLDERPLRRHGRRVLITAAALVACFFLVLPVVFAIVGTHKAREPVVETDLGRPHEQVAFTTDDDLRLRGWYVPSRNGAAVIAFPGRSGPVRHARMLARHGYGVLLFDRRGEGESEGTYNARGWGGEPDLRAALTFLQSRPDVDRGRIGGLGLSVGGELLLETAASTDALRAVVSEGAGMRSLAEQLHMPGVAPWRRWISPAAVETAATAILTGQGPPPDLVDLAGQVAPAQVLLIEAADGNFDERLNEVYRDAAAPHATLWIVPDGGHTGGLSARPDEYERRVTAFFDRNLLRP